MYNRKSLCLAIACSMAIAANAQYNIDYKKSADRFYEKGDTYNAAIYYEKYMDGKRGGKDSSNYSPYSVRPAAAKATDKPATFPKDVNLKTIAYRIAEGYKSKNDYEKAEPWYKKAVADNSFKLARFNHAVCLRALGKHGEAEAEFTQFIKEYNQRDEYSEQAKMELENLHFILQQTKGKEKDLYTIKKENAAINTHGNNSAAFINNKVIYFTSSRKDSTDESTKKLPNINHVVWVDGSGQVQSVGIPNADPKATHQGLATATPDGNTIFFTQWKEVNGKKWASIYKTTKSGSGWAEPVKLNANVNVDGSNAQEPCVSSDGGYLFFASDMPGGKGGFDIWIAALDKNNEAAKAENAGPVVNSKEDERAPFYYAPQSTLVFASKGKIGMGGLDLFSSKGSPATKSWSQPKNMGFPVNSVKDDIYFFSNDDKYMLKDFYLSSDRASECCLEIFTAHKVIKKVVTGKILDSKTKQPLQGVEVKANDASNGKSLQPQVTGTDGTYTIDANLFEQLKATASKQDYNSASITINGDNQNDTLVSADWYLTAIEKPVDTTKPVVEAPQPTYVRFDFNSHEILPEYKDKLDSLVTLLKRESKILVEVGGYTDEKGTEKYNLALGEKRAETVRNYLSKAGVEASRMTVKAYGKCCPIIPETNADGSDNEAARQTNRRVEFKLSGW